MSHLPHVGFVNSQYLEQSIDQPHRVLHLVVRGACEIHRRTPQVRHAPCIAALLQGQTRAFLVVETDNVPQTPAPSAAE